MARENQRLNAIRLTIGNALFIGGAAVIVAGSWLASEWRMLASCLIGGVMAFALAELIAPLPDGSKRRRSASAVAASSAAQANQRAGRGE
jgi:VIT1/CCC1 family predicted Fe2+/Mn2+ transporter